MMKQFEIMEAARQQIIAQLKLADLPYQVDGAEFGVYVTVKDGDTEIDVSMTIKAAAMRTPKRRRLMTLPPPRRNMTSPLKRVRTQSRHALLKRRVRTPKRHAQKPSVTR